MTYIIDYLYHGNTYRTKKIKAETTEQAIRKARIKNIVSIDIEEYQKKDPQILRDF